MKIDLHCHSKYSNRPTLWIMQKLGCPESFTEPVELYHLLRQRGMGAVTITDHNDIRACLDIQHLPNTFTGCEYTTYFPQDGCKVHVLAYGFTEAQHGEMMEARKNIFDLVAYFQAHNIRHACAHPLFGPNGRLTAAHVEILALLFKHWEVNGDQNPEMNACLHAIMDNLTPEAIARMADRHGVAPVGPDPWVKRITAGSDDHSSLNLGTTYTQVPGAETVADFWNGVDLGRGTITVAPSSPHGFARNIYGIAYQFYKGRLGLDRHTRKDVLLHFLDQILQTRPEEPERWMNRVYMAIARRRRAREDKEKTLVNLARVEAEKLIRQDPNLMAMIDGRTPPAGDNDAKWFAFVEQLSNKMILHLGSHVLDRVVGARIFDLFHSVGSAGLLYTLMAPYFVSYSHHIYERNFSRDVLRHFHGGAMPPRFDRAPRVAHFTDTFHEVNGVARTLQQQLAIAHAAGKAYELVTCAEAPGGGRPGLREFPAIGAFAVPEYPEVRLLAPPFLKLLRHCYEAQYTHLHIATPGPVGLAALGIARILRLPVAATYHTAFPQYAQALTDDAYVEDIAWKFMLWFYDQMDHVYVPSRATAADLIERGFNADKIRVYPRGVDTERFHPSKRNGILAERYGAAPGPLNLLYVGRVSKEKNLPLLSRAYEDLLSRGHDVRLIVVGDGPYRGEMAAHLAYTPAVFTGYLHGDDLAAIYASCDALVFPSTTDTFGNVVLEAQASGIPAIVTDVGGPRENVLHGETGLVAEATHEGLLAAMEAMAADPAAREAMGAAARRQVEARAFAPAFNQLYAMYIDERPPVEDPAAPPIPFANALRGVASLAS